MGNGNRAASYIDPDVTLDGVPARKLRTMQSVDGRVAIGSYYIDPSVRIDGVPARRVRAQSVGGTSVYGAYLDPSVRIDGVPTRRHQTGPAPLNEPFFFPFPTVTLENGMIVPKNIRLLFPCKPRMVRINDPDSIDEVEFIAVDAPSPFGWDGLHDASPVYATRPPFPFACRVYEMHSPSPYHYMHPWFGACRDGIDDHAAHGDQYHYMMLNVPGTPLFGQAQFHNLWIEYGIQPDGQYFFDLHSPRQPRWWDCPDDPDLPHIDYHPQSWITSVADSAALTTDPLQSTLFIGDTYLSGPNGESNYDNLHMPFHHVPSRWPSEGPGRFRFPTNDDLLRFFLEPYLVEGWLVLVDPRSSLGQMLGTHLYPELTTERLALGPFNIAILGADNATPPPGGIAPSIPRFGSVTAYLENRSFPGHLIFANVGCNVQGFPRPCDVGHLEVPAGFGKCCISKYVEDPFGPNPVLETICLDYVDEPGCQQAAQDREADFYSWHEFEACVPFNCATEPGGGHVVGACCLPDFGGCLNTTPGECDLLGGDWRGEDTACTDLPYPCGVEPP